jgi:hypothetical protein
VATPFASARHQAALSVPTGYRRFTRVTASRGGVSRVLEPISGRLTQDVRRDGRWDGRLVFAGDDLIPQSPADLLTPFGTTVEVELGLELLDGSVSTVPYGTYEISSSKTRTLSGDRVTDVGLSDISGQVDRYRFEQPHNVAASADLAQVVNSVVNSRLGVNPNLSLIGVLIGSSRVLGLDPGTGPWSEVQDILAGFSRVAWYDRVGLIQIASVNLDADSAYSFDLLTSLDADFDTLPPNVVVARGEAVDGETPIQAVAMDTDPGSPTYAGTGPGTSPYGRVTKFFSSPLLQTEPQALAAAQTILDRSVGAGATYTLIRPYDPTVDALDVISVRGRAQAVDAVTVDLVGNTSLQVREL